MSQARVAFNPLTWYVTPAGFDFSSAPPLREIYRQIREAGYDAVHVEIPDGMPVAGYRALLDDSGLAPAPGYFQASFADRGARAAVRERARQVAGRHAELGNNRIFIAEQFPAGPRLSRPARGADPDTGRLDAIAEGLAEVAASMIAEGVTPCLHQHVGTWIETPGETEHILAAVDPGLLLLGPDTGHLAWAGADPAAFIARHLDRVGAVHLKDVHAAVAREGRAYLDAMLAHVWTEPGRGDVDLEAVLSVLARFDGWYVVEVDYADQPTPQDTARVSADWIRAHLNGVPA
jgi:inosose dehydratase